MIAGILFIAIKALVELVNVIRFAILVAAMVCAVAQANNLAMFVHRIIVETTSKIETIIEEISCAVVRRILRGDSFFVDLLSKSIYLFLLFTGVSKILDAILGLVS